MNNNDGNFVTNLWLILKHFAETNIDGKQIAKQGGSEWSFTYPTGLRNILKYVKKTYGNPPILITENGKTHLSFSVSVSLFTLFICFYFSQDLMQHFL